MKWLPGCVRPLLLLAVTLTACHRPDVSQGLRPATVQTAPAETAPTRSGTISPGRAAPAPHQSATRSIGGTDPVSGLRWIGVPDLPVQGQQTYRLILIGGPFPYARDGVTFQNREGLLPRRSRGTYHEYTVKTPGNSDRGARRIICAALPECYYTGDHYASFRRIQP